MDDAQPSRRAALLARVAASVDDPRIAARMAALPREAFVPAALGSRAWDDVPLPIGEGQTISQPSLVARMCDLLELRGEERVLDVGTGSGYAAALLAGLCAHVWSIERHASLAAGAAAALDAAGVTAVTLVVGDGTRGYPLAAPFDAIHVAATATGDVPEALVAQLAPGGRLIAPVRDADGERLVRLVRGADGAVARERLDAVRFVPLVPDG